MTRDTTAQLALNLVLLKNISIVGIHWGAYTSTCPELYLHPDTDRMTSARRNRAGTRTGCLEGTPRVSTLLVPFSAPPDPLYSRAT